MNARSVFSQSISRSILLTLLLSLCSCRASDELASGDSALIATGAEALRALEISASDESTCSITNKGVFCWGNTASVVRPPHYISNPRGLTEGIQETFCLLADEGVRCWGPRSTELLYKLDIRGLYKNPLQKTEVAKLQLRPTWNGEGGVLAYGLAKGFEKGGRFVTYKTTKFFDSYADYPYNPEAPEDATTHIFPQALTAVNGNELWYVGRMPLYSPIRIGKVEGPQHAVDGHGTYYALEQGTIKWRKSDSPSLEFEISPFLERIGKFKKISKPPFGHFIVCGLTSTDFVCWDDPKSEIIAKIPAGKLKSATDFAINRKAVCIIDEGDIKCWELAKAQATEVAFKQEPSFPLEKFDGVIHPTNAIPNCESIDKANVALGTQCLTYRGFRFEKAKSSSGATGWIDTAAKTIWFDQLDQDSERNAGAAMIRCFNRRQRLPEMKDLLESEGHGLREVLDDMTGKQFWAANDNPSNSGETFFDGGTVRTGWL